MVHTKWSRFTDSELIRVATLQPTLTTLEAELIQRMSDLIDHVDELEDEFTVELPLQ